MCFVLYGVIMSGAFQFRYLFVCTIDGVGQERESYGNIIAERKHKERVLKKLFLSVVSLVRLD